MSCLWICGGDQSEHQGGRLSHGQLNPSEDMALLTFESMIVEIATCFPFQGRSRIDLVQRGLRFGIGRTATMQQRRRCEEG